MGKQQDSYNKVKPTNRQIKKQNKNNGDNIKLNIMCDFLGKKWNNNITYKCVHCLEEAYHSEVNNIQGYITDEELILCSNNKLRHK